MFATATTTVAVVRPHDLEDVATERLEAELCQVAAQSAAAMCRWLLLVAEHDRREAALSWGCSSTAHWIAWKCGLDARTARDHVRVARALPNLPAIRAAFETGAMPYSKVRALTRVATPATESDLLEFAGSATTAQLERTIREYRRATKDERADDEPAVSEVHPSWDDDGLGRIGGGLLPEDAALVFAAVETEAERLAEEERSDGSREPQSETGGSAEPPRPRITPRPQRLAQALVNLASSYVAHRSSDVGDDRYLAVLHVELDTLHGHVAGGPTLDEAAVRRLLCDQPAAILLKDRAGNPLFMSRTTRTINRSMRRALLFEHRGSCGMPGCTTTVGLHAHHVRFWRDGGPTDITNLVLLCARHHRLVHEGQLLIEPDGSGGFTFRRADGTLLDPAPSLPIQTRTMEESNSDAGVAVVDAPHGGLGEPLALSYAVDGMVSLFQHAR